MESQTPETRKVRGDPVCVLGVWCPRRGCAGDAAPKASRTDARGYSRAQDAGAEP